MTEQNLITITPVDWPKCIGCMHDLIPDRPGCNCFSDWGCDCEWCGGRLPDPEVLADCDIWGTE